MLLQLQTERLQVLLQRNHKGAAKWHTHHKVHLDVKPNLILSNDNNILLVTTNNYLFAVMQYRTKKIQKNMLQQHVEQEYLMQKVIKVQIKDIT